MNVLVGAGVVIQDAVVPLAMLERFSILQEIEREVLERLGNRYRYFVPGL
ncbi:hypothetical protein [Bacillus cereus]|nr:hypothetical protein [Bacillus cereus]